MADGLGRIMSKTDFDVESFVNKQAKGGEDAIMQMRTQIQTLQEDTAVALKKNVYKNYSQFIETSKEISILESDMYQLSHMLTDEKSIMAAMLEMTITGDKVESPDEPEPEPEEEVPASLAFLLEKVEGCSAVTEVPGRHLIHDGTLVELDPEALMPISKIQAFLLNDSLMFATHLPQRRGPVKYAYSCLYELDSLAVVNVRDVGGCKNAFKILMFPDTRMFQAENPKAKRKWLDILEETKRKKTAADNMRKEAAAAAAEKARTPSFAADDSNPFAEDFEEVVQETSRPVSVSIETDFLQLDWVVELPEDLDVCIAQRDFEGAVDLAEKITDHLHGHPKSPAVREYRARVEHRIKQLTEMLVSELQVSPERSLRGGPRAARRAVTQLIRLGKSAQACDLFLTNRSAIFEFNLRQLKLEVANTLYVKKLCKVFFSSLLDTAQEFIKAFPDHYGCFSSFVIWAEKEVEDFVKKFISHVFIAKATLSVIAECVHEAKKYCEQMKEIGLDLTFLLDKAILVEVEAIVKESIHQHMEALKLRCSEDLWRPVNFQTHEALDNFEEDMMDLGFLDIHNYSYDDCFTALTSNTIHFTKSYLNLMTDLLRVYTPELHGGISQALSEILTMQMKHADRSIRSSDFKKEHKYILQNAVFLVDKILPMVQDRYTERTGFRFPRAAEIQFILQKIRTVAKTTVGEFV